MEDYKITNWSTVWQEQRFNYSLRREQTRPIMGADRVGGGRALCPSHNHPSVTQWGDVLFCPAGSSTTPKNRMKARLGRCRQLYLGYRSCLQWNPKRTGETQKTCPDTVKEWVRREADWNRRHTPFKQHFTRTSIMSSINLAWSLPGAFTSQTSSCAC